ncbi:unnamed protein product, partial [Musa textilis]
RKRSAGSSRRGRRARPPASSPAFSSSALARPRYKSTRLNSSRALCLSQLLSNLPPPHKLDFPHTCCFFACLCVEFTLMLPEENHYKKKFASGKLGKDPTVVSSFLSNRREKSRSKRNENDYCGNSYISRN